MNISKYIKAKSLGVRFQNQEILFTHSFESYYEADRYALFYCKECDLTIKLDFAYLSQICFFETCEARKMQAALQ